MTKPYGSEESKKAEVQQMFDAISPTYDKLNHLLSFGMDRLWSRRLVRSVAKSGPDRILDVATGTGDIALAMCRKINGVRVTGIDISSGMLRIAEKKAWEKECGGVDFMCGDAEDIPLEDSMFDVVTAAYGVRNFENIVSGLREMYRVLSSGGEVFILEFSMPRNKLFGSLYRFYFRRILPVIGGWVSSDREAYEYLPRSVGGFPDKTIFLRMLENAGFVECKAQSLTFGVAQIYTGLKK